MIEAGKVYRKRDAGKLLVPFEHVPEKDWWKCIILGTTNDLVLSAITKDLVVVTYSESRMVEALPDAIPARLRRQVVIALFKMRRKFLPRF